MADEDVKKAIKKIAGEQTPGLALPIRARVVKIDEQARLCTVKPLGRDQIENAAIDLIDNVEVPLYISGSDVLAKKFFEILPNAIVRVGFYEGDINQPYVDAILQTTENPLAQPAVLGQTLEALFNAHTHMSPVGPTSNPLAPLTGQELATKVKVL